MTPDLEQALRELDVDWPATPDLAAPSAPAWSRARDAEGARHLEVGGSRPSSRRVLGSVGGMLAVPEARDDRVPLVRASRAWRSSARSRARRRARRWISGPRPPSSGSPVPVLQARELGTPGVYETALPDGSRAASLVYDGPILVQTFRAQASPFIEKTIGTGADVERLDARRRDRVLDHGRARVRVPVARRGRLRAAADRRQHAARRARDGLLLRIEGVPDARARRRDRPLSSVTGPRASSPAARSDGPCGAGPPPTARRGRA